MKASEIYLHDILDALQSQVDAVNNGNFTVTMTLVPVLVPVDDPVELLAANPDRKYALLINSSDEIVYLGLGFTPTAVSGVQINPNGGSYELGLRFGNNVVGSITAVAESGLTNLVMCMEGV